MTVKDLLLCVLLLTAAGCDRGDAQSSATPGGQAAAQAGVLDARFSDLDGDMLADPPSDSTKWVDPPTLIFAYTPLEDPAVYREVWQEFLTHLSSVTGRKVQFFAVQSNAAQLEAMRAGRLHVSGFNTGSVPIGVNFAGFVPFCMMGFEDGTYGYEMEIIVQAGSPLKSVMDLKGRQIAFTQPTSNSGYKAPSVLLKSEFGLEPERDYRAIFSGKHENSVLGVINKDYEAAAVANSVLKRMIQRGAADEAKLRSIYRSKRFPTTAYGYVNNLHPDLAAKVREAFFSFKWEGSRLKREYEKETGTKFLPIRYKEHWAIIRQIDEAMGEMSPAR